MLLRRQEVEPLPNVVALEQTVGSERPAAGTLRASVGEENAVAVSGQQPRVSGHADAVIAEAVKQDNGISVSVPRTDGPGAECDRIGRGDGNILQIGVDCVGGFDHGCFIFRRKRTARRVQCAVGDPDSGDGAEREVERYGKNQASGSAGERHSGLEDDTSTSRVRFREMRLISEPGAPFLGQFARSRIPRSRPAWDFAKANRNREGRTVVSALLANQDQRRRTGLSALHVLTGEPEPAHASLCQP
jgi:hypothetical protein